jgi:hypothetical protein
MYITEKLEIVSRVHKKGGKNGREKTVRNRSKNGEDSLR